MLADLWRLVRPSGQLAVTVLGRRVFTQLIDTWQTAITEARDGPLVELTWQRTDDPDVLAGLFEAAGVEDVDIRSEGNRLPLLADGDL